MVNNINIKCESFYLRATMKLYKILGGVFIFISLTLSACSQDGKEYSFEGKCKHWVIIYETEVTKE